MRNLASLLKLFIVSDPHPCVVCRTITVAKYSYVVVMEVRLGEYM